MVTSYFAGPHKPRRLADKPNLIGKPIAFYY
jgi:hypothetical protein